MKIGQPIYRRKWTGLFFLDQSLEKRIEGIYFFDVSNAYEIKEFQLCKWPSLLIGKVGNLPNCWLYTISDKRNI